jgi:hypothetical protein
VTRQRMYGSDTEFCAWLRSCSELPSIGRDFGLSVSDNDVTLHRFMASVDGQGSREVQAIMQIEVKTRSGKPSFSQMDTLSKLNMFCGQKETRQGAVRFFGVFLLVLSGTSPDDSESIWWGVIPKGLHVTDALDLQWHFITREKLIEILRFDRHPRNLTSNPFRRHHKTYEVVEIETTPLGFECEKKIVKRS